MFVGSRQGKTQALIWWLSVYMKANPSAKVGVYSSSRGLETAQEWLSSLALKARRSGHLPPSKSR